MEGGSAHCDEASSNMDLGKSVFVVNTNCLGNRDAVKFIKTLNIIQECQKHEQCPKENRCLALKQSENGKEDNEKCTQEYQYTPSAHSPDSLSHWNNTPTAASADSQCPHSSNIKLLNADFAVETSQFPGHNAKESGGKTHPVPEKIHNDLTSSEKSANQGISPFAKDPDELKVAQFKSISKTCNMIPVSNQASADNYSAMYSAKEASTPVNQQLIREMRTSKSTCHLTDDATFQEQPDSSKKKENLVTRSQTNTDKSINTLTRSQADHRDRVTALAVKKQCDENPQDKYSEKRNIASFDIYTQKSMYSRREREKSPQEIWRVADDKHNESNIQKHTNERADFCSKQFVPKGTNAVKRATIEKAKEHATSTINVAQKTQSKVSKPERQEIQTNTLERKDSSHETDFELEKNQTKTLERKDSSHETDFEVEKISSPALEHDIKNERADSAQQHSIKPAKYEVSCQNTRENDDQQIQMAKSPIPAMKETIKNTVSEHSTQNKTLEPDWQLFSDKTSPPQCVANNMKDQEPIVFMALMTKHERSDIAGTTAHCFSPEADENTEPRLIHMSLNSVQESDSHHLTSATHTPPSGYLTESSFDGFESLKSLQSRSSAQKSKTRQNSQIPKEYDRLKNLHAAITSKQEREFYPELGKSASLDFIQRVVFDIVVLPSLFPSRQEQECWEIWRLSTFSSLVDLVVYAIRLAQSGFYYDQELDDIKCFSCGVRKRRWTKSDYPAQVHLALSPDCDQANFRDQRNVPITSYADLSSEQGSNRPASDSDAPAANGEHTDAHAATQSPTVSSQHSESETRPSAVPNGSTSTSSENVGQTQTDARSTNRIFPSTQNSLQSGVDQQLPVQAGTASKGSAAASAAASAGAENVTSLPQNGTSLALPRPAGRKEAIERHQRLAAQSAGTALPNSSLAPLAQNFDNFDNFNPPAELTSANVYVCSTTSQAPSVSNTTAGAELCRYPVQAEQAATATPDQGNISVLTASNGLQRDSSPETTDAAQTEVSGAGGLDTTRAASPVNALVRTRLATFADWPTRGLPNRRLLVMAGFYYTGTGDTVRCFFCGVTLKNWRQNDDPWQTHVRFRFSCEYVSSVKGDQFVQDLLVKIARGRSVDDVNEADNSTTSRSLAASNGGNSSPQLSNGTQQRSLPAGQTRTSGGTNTAAPSVGNKVRSSSGNTVGNSAVTATAGGRDSVDAGRGSAVAASPRSATGQPPRNTTSGSARNGTANSDQHAATSNRASEGASASRQPSSASSSGQTNGTVAANDRGRKGSSGASNAATRTANQGGLGNVTVGQVLQFDAEPVGAANTRSKTSSPRRQHAARQAVAAGQPSAVPQTTVSREHPATSNTSSRNVSSQDQEAYLQQLQDTNRRLRQRRTCRLCGTREVNTIFLPCGHLCTCDLCAATISDCCLCHDRIRGTAHVYLE